MKNSQISYFFSQLSSVLSSDDAVGTTIILVTTTPFLSHISGMFQENLRNSYLRGCPKIFCHLLRPSLAVAVIMSSSRARFLARTDTYQVKWPHEHRCTKAARPLASSTPQGRVMASAYKAEAESI